MTKTAKSFYDLYNGAGYDLDGAFGKQCVDGARIWMLYFIGKSIPTGNGWASGYVLNDKQWFLDNGCTFISSPSQLQDGDLVVWGKGGSHKDSHVAMYYQGKSFGMNQGGNRNFNLKSTNFSDMIGAYRSKNCKKVTSTNSEKSYKKVKLPRFHIGDGNERKFKVIPKVGLNLRECNSQNSKRLCTIPCGDEVKYYGYYDLDETYKQGSKNVFWIWVLYNGKTGFVKGKSAWLSGYEE